MKVIKRDGSEEQLNVDKIHKCVAWACENLENVSISDVETNAHVQFFDGITTTQIHSAMIKSAAELISEESPDYEYVAARLLLQQIVKECGNLTFGAYVGNAIQLGKLTNELVEHYDYSLLNSAIKNERNLNFKYLGLTTLYDRYFIKDDNGKVIESPQNFFMRVACGICLNEPKEIATEKAIELYELFSNFDYSHSTPTLFNAGTLHPQMSSCYLNVMYDGTFEASENSIFGNGIMSTMAETAMLSKFAGGVGTDFTYIRPSGSSIAGTNGVSSGIVPALKIYNDVALFFNQGGKRKGSFAPYAETWHGDIESYIDLKKPTGDERLRARDIFPYNWIPDLFMERVQENGVWSLFDSHLYPELHELWGEEFKARYLELESEGRYIKQISAMELWKKSISSLAETGAPMNTFKDAFNKRNPQRHVGSIKSSNLCSEIGEVTSDDETAVCNLASINASKVSLEDLKRVVPVAVRALDNVIDKNFYPSDKAKASNLRHRPIGLGMMGWYEYLIQNNIDFESQAHLDECDKYFEELAYWTIKTSCELAKEKGRYESFEGSDWSKGILPYMTDVNFNRQMSQRWWDLAEEVKVHGVRNSVMIAIAPTATIANILGTTASIEPPYKLSYMDENLSGKFLVIDPSLRYKKPEITKTAFEIDQEWVIRAAATRQTHIDQAQSLNLFRKQGTKGRDLSNWYVLAWKLGLKSTYYLRNEILEKTHTDLGKVEETIYCSIDNPDCSSCQ